ncbi:ABC transporter ATP-binding protein [Bradyrhizobium sp. AUGA SZCCT0177]|uniref:ABC transporter ATP-binding protein n=1 Tax=Bradyrhizobium sp. AUGA SZCCT0177 TaxID=2807665 RepID=UPI001BAAB613|nr:ABC transporter ATP-binding protein [Bradyrhizobium sp. AUGA SZCCT0177]MBR1286148.1 ABC transporter ATP-binding protein [Bradyrhizobium sp. AUGA SZCCT0177]
MSSEIAIRCQGLGKRYLVPARRRGSTIENLVGHFKEYTSLVGRDEADYFWALHDVGFEVKAGEILGVIGRNGSGKSTLLKILSGVTDPTEGSAELRGRVGSLLEVGTGFHPDLTGRENIFMAGALLGLNRSEIAKQLDEIIDFAGIDRFIDAPVKRYSSGMYVRLAFSVASLLRSDILILDEVLAVGDSAFKEKSENNINKIANDGRTVLLVSHSMQAIRHMCERAIVLDKGRLVVDQPADEAVSQYLRSLHPDEGADLRNLSPLVDLTAVESEDWPRPFKTIKSIETATPSGPTRTFQTGETMLIRIRYEMPKLIAPCYFTVFVVNDVGERMFVSYSYHDQEKTEFPQRGVIECRIDALPLLDGIFHIDLDFGAVQTLGGLRYLDYINRATTFAVEQGNYLSTRPNLKNQGLFALRSRWNASG